jgi:hypothetical protein
MILLVGIMAAAFIFVDLPVASLQCDLDTQGSVTLTAGNDQHQLQLVSFRRPDGNLRIIIRGMSPGYTFNGKIAEVSMPVNGISNSIGSDPQGNDMLDIEVITVQKPGNVRVVIDSN